MGALESLVVRSDPDQEMVIRVSVVRVPGSTVPVSVSVVQSALRSRTRGRQALPGTLRGGPEGSLNQETGKAALNRQT